MSKKDYQAIAAIIYRARKSVLHAQIVDHIAAELADVCKRDNSAFDRDRFREACETGKTRGMRQIA